MKFFYILISTTLALISSVIYARAIILGEAKPHRTTRIILLLISILATASLFAQGDTVAIWLAGVSALQSVVIFMLSIKFGMGGWEKRIYFVCVSPLQESYSGKLQIIL